MRKKDFMNKRLGFLLLATLTLVIAFSSCSTIIPSDTSGGDSSDGEINTYTDEHGVEYIQIEIDLTKLLEKEMRNPMKMYGKWKLIIRVSEWGYRVIINGINISEDDFNKVDGKSDKYSNFIYFTSKNEYNDEFMNQYRIYDREIIEEERFLDVLSLKFIHRFTVNFHTGIYRHTGQDEDVNEFLSNLETHLENSSYFALGVSASIKCDISDNKNVKSKLMNYISHLKSIGYYTRLEEK